MKIDYCDACGQTVYFENTKCLSCERPLAFFPDVLEVGTLYPAAIGAWRRIDSASDLNYRFCKNRVDHDNCNWMVPATDPNPLCASCRLTRTIPDLSNPANSQAWFLLEAAKRRLVYGLLSLELPLRTKMDDAEHGLAFDFLGNVITANGETQSILTGHANGVITINIAEADDVERESRRKALGEPYRTLLGHFRHEIGHYYWDQLIAKTSWLTPFRQLFGDETAESYGDALQRHYAQPPNANWSERFISAYAASHPWEDWAETWAHYLHMVDCLEISRSFGLKLRNLPVVPNQTYDRHGPNAFQKMLDSWLGLTCVLNNLNRGLGLRDGYPFILSAPVIDKLRFIHDVIDGSGKPTNLAPEKPANDSLSERTKMAMAK